MEGQTEIYQVKECPVCNGCFTNEQKLTCHHIICGNCVTKHTTQTDNEKYVACPYNSCEQSTPLLSLKSLPPFLPTQCKSGKPRSIYDEFPELQKSQKTLAMEDDLKPEADEMGKMEQSSDTDEDDDFDTENKCSITRKTNDQELVSQVKAMTLDPKDKSETKETPAISNTESTDWDVMTTLENLWDACDDCPEIYGFYENEIGDKIIIDIEAGKKDIVIKFLMLKFKSDYEAKRLDIVPQSSRTDYLVAIGAKVAANRRNHDQYIDKHPDVLQERSEFGTVSCLGKDANDKRYILTAKHIFSEKPPHQETGCFISSNHGKLKRVSDGYRGVLGGVRKGRGIPHLVDIAALPLRDDITSDLESCPQLIHNLEKMYEDNDARNNSLHKKIVFKNGAVTGYTCGEIIIPNYNLRSDKIKGTCFVIQSKVEGKQFAEKGDSGALIWTEQGEPFGIVSYHNEELEYNKCRIRATFGVRLDYCLHALRTETNIDIATCQAYGSPIPVCRENPDPSRSNFLVTGAEASG